MLHLNSHDRSGDSSPRRIMIVRSLPGLGDLLCLVPALRALRAALPTSHMTLVGLPLSQQFVERFSHYLNDWLEFPGFPGIPEVPFSPSRCLSWLADVQRDPVDLAIQMHGSGIYSNPFTAMLGAQFIAGCYLPGHYCPDEARFLPYPNGDHEIHRLLKLLDYLGIPAQGDALEFPLWESDWQAFEAIATTHDLRKGEYVCIHPGASAGTKRWPPHPFAQVADHLAARGLQIVLTGTRGEASLTQAVAEAMRYPAVDLTGKTNLGAIAALLKASCLLICNDTGVSHLAAALQVRSVVIFSASDPQRWAPLNRQLHRVVLRPGCAQPEWNDTMHSRRLGITSETPVLMQVQSQANDLLQDEFAYAV